MNGGLVVRVEGTAVVRLETEPPLAAKILPGPALLLVGSAAGLLAGDLVRIDIDLAAGAHLTVRSTAATIAHPCRQGGSTSLEVDCRLGAGARLVWLPEPLIACAACDHSSRARLALAPRALATWLDTVTLGRSGEQPGRFSQRLDVTLDGVALLRESLRVGRGADGWDGPAVLGPNRHFAALHSFGRRVLPAPVPAGAASPGAVMQLAGPGTTARFVAGRADQLDRQVAAALPWFLDPLSSPCPKEAVHA